MASLAHLGNPLPQSDAFPVPFDLVDIRLFLNIAERQSLTQGAEHSYMSPPAASVRIKNIEERLGTKLLHRTSQGVSPTDAGKAFLHHGRLLLRQLEDLHQDLRECASGMKGWLRMFATASAVTEFLPPVVSSFLSAHPEVNIDLREGMTSEIVRAVSEGTADIGIVEGGLETEGLEVFPYLREPLMLVTPKTHVLARRESVHFEETLAFDHIALLESSPLRNRLGNAATMSHRSLKPRIQVGSYQALCRMVETGVGIGVVPESVAMHVRESLSIQVIRLADSWAVRELQGCVRKIETLPAFAKDFVDRLLIDASNYSGAKASRTLPRALPPKRSA